MVNRAPRSICHQRPLAADDWLVANHHQWPFCSATALVTVHLYRYTKIVIERPVSIQIQVRPGESVALPEFSKHGPPVLVLGEAVTSKQHVATVLEAFSTPGGQKEHRICHSLTSELSRQHSHRSLNTTDLHRKSSARCMNQSVKIPALVLLAASTFCQAGQDRVDNASGQICQDNDIK